MDLLVENLCVYRRDPVISCVSSDYSYALDLLGGRCYFAFTVTKSVQVLNLLKQGCLT